MFSILDLIPTALKTTSALIIISLLSDSTVISTFFPTTFEPTTLEEVKTFNPAFFKIFSNSFEISLSSIGAIFFSYSINVTFVPIVL